VPQGQTNVWFVFEGIRIPRKSISCTSRLTVIDRLLTTTAGLETFLSTINYALYILAYLEHRSRSRSGLLKRLFEFAGFSVKVSHSQSSKNVPQTAAPLDKFGRLISDTRTTLRLTALLPLYTWLRELLAVNRRQDEYLRAIALTQCISYIFYQFTENVAYLADRGVVPQKWVAKRGGSANWWIWSNRAWLAGVSCDYLRLFREALIERERRTAARKDGKASTEDDMEKQHSIDSIWWSEIFVASCWFPLCLHYSLHNGLKGVNSGVVGLLGSMAGAQSFFAHWANTKVT
jgi:Peroxisomal biogenesis factor 11 (PEX11)